ncbi:hypothetical protein Rleg2_1135 [Rhizobium leguminosarum bv. trifolii WSM2304]|uniref:DUF3085 domain-containing protein n=1 Tax=Rhizobium leguminosarum bv. trifolii (strain WSM2304) TaxID=395492 RepID=A0ABF7QKB3_RHILW|nr:hypothetical protein [Rhizobium leguminosarum]ACI54429.1 hypothetical protein Rleg2_1135 [Rhizobium leguminosarum bv. trifolii WSM2304]
MNETKALTLEAGKYYRTREGEKVFVAGIGIFGLTNRHRVAVLTDQNGEDCLRWYAEDGKFNIYNDEEPADIVAEWVEPKRIKGFACVFAATSSKNSGVLSDIRPTKEAALEPFRPEMVKAVIEIDILEGHGLNGGDHE